MRESARSEYGARLLAARQRAGLTQTELARRAGMSQSTYAQAETTGSGSSKTPQLAAACNVSARWLATGEGEMISTLGWPGTRFTLEEINQWPSELVKSVEDFALFHLAGAKPPALPSVTERKNGLTVGAGGTLTGQLSPASKEGKNQGGQRTAAPAKRATG